MRCGSFQGKIRYLGQKLDMRSACRILGEKEDLGRRFTGGGRSPKVVLLTGGVWTMRVSPLSFRPRVQHPVLRS